MKEVKKKCVYIIEPHPDDALGSASGLLYNSGINTVICTMTKTRDTRDQIELVKEFQDKHHVLRQASSIVRQWKFWLDDLHWNLRGDLSLPYGDTVTRYHQLYGKEHNLQLKQSLKQILTAAMEESAQVAFPMGLIHPMHVLVSSMMLTCVLELDFPRDLLWIYVDHPYDVYCIGSGRMSECRDFIEKKLGVSFTRYDCDEIDQEAVGEVLRNIYGNVHHAEFSDVFRKTLCSFFLTGDPQTAMPSMSVKSNRVLFLTDQALPYYKRGGLGDVSYSFTRTAINYVDQIRIMMLLHKENYETSLPGLEMEVKQFSYCSCDKQMMEGVVRTYLYDGIIYYLIDMPELLEWDAESRYAILADVIIGKVLPILDYQPNIVHCNDWQMGFIPFLLKTKYRDFSPCWNKRILYTIHSYGYQGICNKQNILRIVGLTKQDCRLCPICSPECPLDRINYLGPRQQKLIGAANPVSASFMKAGIFFSDRVSTVSPGYAKELESYPEIKGISITGIRNGIGPETYSPSNNPSLVRTYSEDSFAEGKAENKRLFQQRCGLDEEEELPLFCMVTRLSQVKGIHSVLNIIERLMVLPLQLVIVGDDAEYQYASLLENYSKKHRGKFWYSPFHPELEFQVYAAADILLMPSLSEACGMTQILAMRYGVIPIVSLLSSIQDTVTPIHEETMEKGVGYLVYNDDCWMLYEAILVVLEDFKDKKTWHRLVHKNMLTDFTWHNGPLKDYVHLYHGLQE